MRVKFSGILLHLIFKGQLVLVHPARQLPARGRLVVPGGRGPAGSLAPMVGTVRICLCLYPVFKGLCELHCLDKMVLGVGKADRGASEAQEGTVILHLKRGFIVRGGLAMVRREEGAGMAVPEVSGGKVEMAER